MTHCGTRSGIIRLGAVGLGLTAMVLYAGGCKSTPRATTPAELGAETPEQIQAQLARATKLVRQAERTELAGQQTKAIEQYRAAIAEYRELPVAWNNVGRLLMERGENLQAADAFKTASELSPTDPRPLHNLGTLWESLGYYDDAARWYDEALKRDENYLPALRRVVVVEEVRNKPTARTLERIRTALLVERDPFWIDRMRRASMRFDQMVKDAARDSGSMAGESVSQ